MSLTLCLHASGRAPRVFLLDRSEVAPESPPLPRQDADPAFGPSLAELTVDALSHANRAVGEVDRIVIDVGPGRLSAVRASVSFANALAFALGRPLLPICSSYAAGWQAWRRLDVPAIVVHKSAAGAAYVGRVDEGRLAALRHGPLEQTLKQVVAGSDAIAIIGVAPEIAAATLPHVAISHGGDGEIEARSFAALLKSAPDDAFVSGPVHPITEQSDEVHD